MILLAFVLFCVSSVLGCLAVMAELAGASDAAMVASAGCAVLFCATILTLSAAAKWEQK